MSEPTSGLNALATPATTEAQGSIPYQPAKSTGIAEKLALNPTQTEDILANMQKYIDEREGFVPSLAKGLSLGMATARGPAALTAMQREQSLEDKQIMDYRTQMATFRAAQDKAKSDAAKWAQLGGTGGAGTGGAGAGGAGAGMAGGVQISPAQKQKEDLAGSDAERIALRQEYLKTLSTEGIKADLNPASLDRKDALVTDPQTGQTVLRPVNAFEYRSLKAAGLIKDPTEFYNLRPAAAAAAPAGVAPGGAGPLTTRLNNPGAMRDTKTGDFRTFATPEEGGKALEEDLKLKIAGQSPAVKGRFGDQVGSFISPAMLAETWSPATAEGNSPEKTANYAKYIATKLGIEPTAQIPNTPEAIGAAKQAISEFESGQYGKAPAEVARPAPAAAAPAAAAPAAAAPAAAAPARTGMPDIATMQAEQLAAKEEGTSAAQARGKSGEAARAEFENEIRPANIAEDKETSKRIQTLVKENPEITGVLAGPGYAKAIAGQLERGIGNISVNDLSKAILQTLPSTTNLTMAQQNELGTYLARMELKAAKLIKGQGQITEGEREILQRASSSLRDPAESIYKKAKMLERITDMNAELGEIYGDGSKYPNFRAFSMSKDPRVLDIHKRYQKDLNDILNEPVNFARPTGPATTPKTQHPEDIQNIINRNKVKKAG